jgi:hypothetical protein
MAVEYITSLYIGTVWNRMQQCYGVSIIGPGGINGTSSSSMAINLMSCRTSLRISVMAGYTAEHFPICEESKQLFRPL